MIAEAHGGGKSFKGVAAYCLKLDRETLKLDARRRKERGERLVVERMKPSGRVEWTDVRNLATSSVRTAARHMAATVQYAGELKRLAGVSQAGRPLSKPVYHYSLSWAKDERPSVAEMSRAVDQSMRALGMEDRQAFVVAHNDTRHRHLHVVVNRVSAEDGRAASRSNDRLKLSRWAERWEREHGGLRCERRAEHNRRRAAGEWVVDETRVANARHRRSRPGIERERIDVEETRHPHERWADVVDAAQRRLHERRVWEWVQESAAPVRSDMEKNHRGEWADLLARQDGDPEGDESQQRRERAELGREQGRAARQLEERVREAYREGVGQQPPGWEDGPELEAEIEQLGGLSPYGRTSFEGWQREARWAREAGRPPPETGRDRGGGPER